MAALGAILIKSKSGKKLAVLGMFFGFSTISCLDIAPSTDRC
jgi:hypothetical protein